MEYKTKTIYRCPYCLKEYDNFEDCQICVYNCAEFDSVIEEKITFYVCGYCNKEFKEEEECLNCEKQHEEDNDEFYSQRKLNEAREHPEQKKLI